MRAQRLASFGSHDPESKQEIRKREEFETLKELLKERDCTIEEVAEDGNCLFRAVARQIYGTQEEFQKVRDEAVEWIVANRDWFELFETNFDERLSEQLMNRS